MTVTLQWMITSVAAHGDHYFVGTSKSNVYYLNAKTFKEELRQTCHFERINDVCFPQCGIVFTSLCLYST